MSSIARSICLVISVISVNHHYQVLSAITGKTNSAVSGESAISTYQQHLYIFRIREGNVFY